MRSQAKQLTTLKLLCVFLTAAANLQSAEPRYTVELIDTAPLSPYVWGLDVNEFGAMTAIAGTNAYYFGTTHEAVFYTSTGGVERLGALPGDSEGLRYFVKNFGQVAGESSDTNNFPTPGFLLSHPTRMIDIGTLGGAKTVVQ